MVNKYVKIYSNSEMIDRQIEIMKCFFILNRMAKIRNIGEDLGTLELLCTVGEVCIGAVIVERNLAVLSYSYVSRYTL